MWSTIDSIKKRAKVMIGFVRTSMALACCTFGLIAGNAADAQIARQGEDGVTHIFTYVDKVMKIGDRITIFRELSEVSRNDKVNGMFHNLGIRCWGFIDVVENKPSATGRCIETDTDGDQLFSTYENKAGRVVRMKR